MPWPPVFGKVFMLPLEDGFARRFYYLRLSVTDVCNFRCTYCLPDGYHPSKGGAEGRKSFLSLEEIRRVVSGFAAMGTRKVRLTGGEPSLRRDFTAIIETVANTPGIEKVAMTTNGYRLKERAREWFDAGLTALNVSVDSLDPRQFHQITGENKLADVMAGIDAALARWTPCFVTAIPAAISSSSDCWRRAGCSSCGGWTTALPRCLCTRNRVAESGLSCPTARTSAPVATVCESPPWASCTSVSLVTTGWNCGICSPPMTSRMRCKRGSARR